MKRSYRYDLPKGHIEPGETELQCALRELFEETGISNKQVCLELDFRFKTIYYPRYRRFGGQKVEKSLVIFFAWVSEELEIVMTEHSDSIPILKLLISESSCLASRKNSKIPSRKSFL